MYRGIKTDSSSFPLQVRTIHGTVLLQEDVGADPFLRSYSYGMVWGVLLSSLRKDHYPNTSLATLTLCAGLQNLFQNVTPFISGRLGEKFGFKRMIAIGSISSVCFLIFSGLAVESLPALFVVQGALLGICHGISLPLVSVSFRRNRSLLELHAESCLLRSVHDFTESMVLETAWISYRDHRFRNWIWRRSLLVDHASDSSEIGVPKLSLRA